LSLVRESLSPQTDTAEHRVESRPVGAVETLELMRRLQAAESRVVEEAAGELARRGFTKTHVELARKMFHPEPAVRRDLVRQLPGVPGVDAAPWLLALSEDEDCEVRLSAITVMATTGDRVLLEAIARIARDDPNPQIRRQAEKISGRSAQGRF
jgi:hypothetical protein